MFKSLWAASREFTEDNGTSRLFLLLQPLSLMMMLMTAPIGYVALFPQLRHSRELVVAV